MRLQAIALVLAGATAAQSAIAQTTASERIEALVDRQGKALSLLSQPPEIRAPKACEWADELRSEEIEVRNDAIAATSKAMEQASLGASRQKQKELTTEAGRWFAIALQHHKILGFLDGLCVSVSADLQLKTDYSALAE
ncbi:hypothetical protein [Croceicoccus gelatinilyticus]|uniref:hypothetical protein n=1 Tax=Croceicoccus gelatinilyticus TaxID=2835536 RepID=UPI001BCD8E5D|nr:hypothetical protein [Croceicoccus gelatinilyticus]MBS7671549.1 hypothetical protein [Croceicoccus gelatinilyticus]